MVAVRRTVVKGLDDLADSFRSIARAVSPQGRLADMMFAGGEVAVTAIKSHILKQRLYKTGALLESVVAIKVNQYRIDVLVQKVYAAAHEYGATIIVPVTARSRRFFWYMYLSTGDEKWKGMALSRKTQFVVEITAKPYVRPALKMERWSIIAAIQGELLDTLKAAA